MSVVIVTHDSAAEIRGCLSSLRNYGARAGQEVIVVDNASTDGTADLVASEFPEVRLVASTRRRGFAANCNHGARVAQTGTLLFLNPDARVKHGAIDALLDLLSSNEQVAVAGPRLVYPDGRLQPSARRFPTFLSVLVRRTPLRWVLRNSKGERRHLMLDGIDERACLHEPLAVDWLLGAAVAVPNEVYRKLGGMDEGYRLYCEDIDLCWRAWEAGYRVVQVPVAVVEHELRELTRHRFFTRATLWHFKSMFRFVLRHGLRPPALARVTS